MHGWMLYPDMDSPDHERLAVDVDASARLLGLAIQHGERRQGEHRRRTAGSETGGVQAGTAVAVERDSWRCSAPCCCCCFQLVACDGERAAAQLKAGEGGRGEELVSAWEERYDGAIRTPGDEGRGRGGVGRGGEERVAQQWSIRRGEREGVNLDTRVPQRLANWRSSAGITVQSKQQHQQSLGVSAARLAEPTSNIAIPSQGCLMVCGDEMEMQGEIRMEAV